jgi:hypothetical protein
LAFFLGAIWYGVFSDPWMAAAGLTMEQVGEPGPGMCVVPFLAWLVGAATFHCIACMASVNGLAENLKLGFLGWLGFAAPAILFSIYFGMRGSDLYWIDGLYVLISILLIAATRGLIRR